MIAVPDLLRLVDEADWQCMVVKAIGGPPPHGGYPDKLNLHAGAGLKVAGYRAGKEIHRLLTDPTLPRHEARLRTLIAPEEVRGQALAGHAVMSRAQRKKEKKRVGPRMR